MLSQNSFKKAEVKPIRFILTIHCGERTLHSLRIWSKLPNPGDLFYFHPNHLACISREHGPTHNPYQDYIQVHTDEIDARAFESAAAEPYWYDSLKEAADQFEATIEKICAVVNRQF